MFGLDEKEINHGDYVGPVELLWDMVEIWNSQDGLEPGAAQKVNRKPVVPAGWQFKKTGNYNRFEINEKRTFLRKVS